MLVIANAKEIPLADKSVDVVVTSPPYWGLRNYGESENEIGKESLSEYLESLFAVAAEVHRVLKDDGVCWVNIGDTAAGSGGAGGDYNKGGKQEGRVKWKQGESGMAPKQWCNIPARFSVGMQDMNPGWLLRSEVVWDKGKMRPESLDHVKRPGVSHEKIFMFTKPGAKNVFYPQLMAEKGNVWHFAPEVRSKDHCAPYPVNLPLRCLECSVTPGMTVLDPFHGSGTTELAAKAFGCTYVGLDLYV